jgi:rRNA small subunit pseudouridine methyltransferase Nep1
VIWVNPETRLPRVYERFKGVIEKLYQEPVVEADGKILLKLEEKTLGQLLDEVKPDLKILLSEKGELIRWSSFGELVTSARRPAIMIGGFPHGDFHKSTYEAADKILSLWPEPLEAWIITSRTISIVEHMLGVGERI